jgi:hypothetical protein
MLNALVCSLSFTPNLAVCTEENALVVVRDPETFASPGSCLMHGQAYLAETAIGRDLSKNETIKVLCVRNGAVTSNSTVPTAQ